MPTTYQAIATVTVGSGGASSIDFTSIPATYTDLAIMISGRADSNPYTASYAEFRVRFNSNTLNYTMRNLRTEDGTSATSGTDTKIAMYIPSTGATSSTFGNVMIYVPNYAGSANKSVSIDGVIENNATATAMGLVAGLWSDTTAITAVNLIGISTNFAQYSTATLYGIKNS